MRKNNLSEQNHLDTSIDYNYIFIINDNRYNDWDTLLINIPKNAVKK